MLIKEYGDFKATFEGGSFIFRPSLKNINKVGTSTEIVDLLLSLYYSDAIAWAQSFDSVDSKISRQVSIQSRNKAISSAILVLSSCCDEDISAMTGKIVFGSKVRYQIGLESPDVLIVLARHLMKHGVIGVSNKESTNKKSKPVKEFNPHHFVSLMMNHLDFNRDDAWNMSMSEFLHHWEVKFPDSKDKANAEIEQDREDIRRCEELRRKIKEQRND